VAIQPNLWLGLNRLILPSSAISLESLGSVCNGEADYYCGSDWVGASKRDTPYVPVTPDEIAETAYLCEQAGASIIHVTAAIRMRTPLRTTTRSKRLWKRSENAHTSSSCFHKTERQFGGSSASRVQCGRVDSDRPSDRDSRPGFVRNYDKIGKAFHLTDRCPSGAIQRVR